MPQAPPEPACGEYPFVLLTGRGGSSQWHTQTRTSKSAVLRKLHRVDPCVEVSPADAERLGIEDETIVCVLSRRASMEFRAAIRPTMKPGQVFIPMHHVGTNRLPYPAVDPHSRKPSYKHRAVHIERAG